MAVSSKQAERTEREIAEKVLKDLRAVYRGGVIIKHNDIGTKSIPDISVQYSNRISWSELKFLREGKKLSEIIDGSQLVFTHQCATVNNGRAWVIVYDRPLKRTWVWTPRALFANHWPHLAVDFDGWNRIGRDPVEISNHHNAGLKAALDTFGGFWVAGWHYDMMTHLIRQFLRAERA